MFLWKAMERRNAGLKDRTLGAGRKERSVKRRGRRILKDTEGVEDQKGGLLKVEMRIYL